MKLAEAVEDFLMDREARCSPKTTAWYRWPLEGLISFAQGVDLEEISPQIVRSFIIQQRRRERADFGKGTLSPSSIAGIVRALRAFFRYHLDAGNITADPSRGIRAPRASHPPKALTEDQVRHVMSEVATSKGPNALRDRALIMFAIDSGCRAAEILGLRFRDLNLTEGYADVLGKGSKVRRVGLSAATAAAMTAYSNGRNQGPVFLTDEGTPLKYAGLRQALRRLGARVGIPLHAHMFRHTFGTLMIARGADTASVQCLLGHANLETTEIYVSAARAGAALNSHRKYSPIATLTQVGK